MQEKIGTRSLSSRQKNKQNNEVVTVREKVVCSRKGDNCNALIALGVSGNMALIICAPSSCLVSIIIETDGSSSKRYLEKKDASIN